MESRAEGEEAAAPWRGRGAGRLGLEGRGLGVRVVRETMARAEGGDAGRLARSNYFARVVRCALAPTRSAVLFFPRVVPCAGGIGCA